MGKETYCKKDTRNTHIAVIGLYIAIFAGPKDHKGNLGFFRLFLFVSVGHKQKHNV